MKVFFLFKNRVWRICVCCVGVHSLALCRALEKRELRPEFCRLRCKQGNWVRWTQKRKGGGTSRGVGLCGSLHVTVYPLGWKEGWRRERVVLWYVGARNIA